jgi:hypothetical protein
MAEALGVAASLVALLGLTTSIAQGIYSAHYAVTKVHKELQAIKDDITIFSGILHKFKQFVNCLEAMSVEEQGDGDAVIPFTNVLIVGPTQLYLPSEA